jgi:hypothetical protein
MKPIKRFYLTFMIGAFVFTYIVGMTAILMQSQCYRIPADCDLSNVFWFCAYILAALGFLGAALLTLPER